MQLYRRIERGKRVHYEPVEEPVLSEALNDSMTEREIISAVATLAVLAINGYHMLLPEKTYVANRVKDVREAVLKMFKGTGAKVDDDTLQHVLNTWNKTMWALSGKASKP